LTEKLYFYKLNIHICGGNIVNMKNSIERGTKWDGALLETIMRAIQSPVNSAKLAGIFGTMAIPLDACAVQATIR
jgi:hypothetical protein